MFKDEKGKSIDIFNNQSLSTNVFDIHHKEAMKNMKNNVDEFDDFLPCLTKIRSNTCPSDEYCDSYYVEKNGCDTCKCLRGARLALDQQVDPRICATKSKDVVKCNNHCNRYARDQFNCTTCHCKSGRYNDPTVEHVLNLRRKKAFCTKLDDARCEKQCEFYVYDSHNCKTCDCFNEFRGNNYTSLTYYGMNSLRMVGECTGAIPMCADYCHEFVYGKDSCMTCKCMSGKKRDLTYEEENTKRKNKKCLNNDSDPRLCLKVCEQYYYDNNNCNTCSCFIPAFAFHFKKTLIVHECDATKCKYWCKEYVIDAFDCMTCQCV